MKSILFLLLGVLTSLIGVSQDSTSHSPEKIFYDTRIINGQSVETTERGVLKFIISHRFGRINDDGGYNLFGLDNASIRFGVDYGITDNLTVGYGRSSHEKTYDAFLKYRIFRQFSDNKPPVSLTFFTDIAYKTLRTPEGSQELNTAQRLYYTYQLLVARKFNGRFSAQLVPSLIHRNYVEDLDPNVKNDVFSIGSSLWYNVSKRFSISIEYTYVLPNQLAEIYTNPLAFGFNFETHGHVFQLQLGNSTGMIDKMFITETTGDWLKGDVRLGFNITRDFRFGNKK